MRKKKQRYNYGLQTSQEYHQIMINHAEWLDSYYSKEVGDKCREDAKKYLKEKR